MLNKIFIMGRLTRDPELRRTQSGTAVTSFSLAVDRDYKSQSGEKETDFIDVVAWRSTAEFVAKYFTKGRMAVVEGRLQIRDWKDKDGNILNEAGNIMLHKYSNYIEEDGAFKLKSSEYEWNEDGSLTIFAGKRLLIYNTTVNGQTDYSVEFKTF